MPAIARLGTKLFIDRWLPAAGEYGLFPSIVASCLVTALSLALSLPPSTLFSIYVALYASPRVRDAVRVLTESLAGIPSVIYGAWGLLWLVPLINRYIGPFLGATLGRYVAFLSFTPSDTGNLLAGSIVLAVMVLPILVFAQIEFLQAVPREFVEASLACGATRWQMVKTVALPYALPGVLVGVVLGLGRAVGETMAISMVAGPTNPPSTPNSLFSPATPLTTLILMNIGSLTPGFFEWSVLFSAALILLSISVLAVAATKLLAQRKQEIGVYNLLYTPSGKAAFLEESVVRSLMVALCLLVGSILACIVGEFLIKGVLATADIGPRVVTECLRLVHQGGEVAFSGGLLNDVVGSFLLSLLSAIVAFPIGLLTGIYLAEYAGERWLSRAIRVACEAMSSIPSVVLGLLGFALFVIYAKAVTGGISLLSGSLTLSVFVVPYIARSVEEGLRSVPQGIKEAVYAVGGTRAHVVLVSLKQIRPILAAAFLSGFLRALSESAPILFTAGPSDFVPRGLWDPVGCLPVRIYLLGFEFRVFKNAVAYLYAAATLLMLLIILVNIPVRVLAKRWRRYVV